MNERPGFETELVLRPPHQYIEDHLHPQQKCFTWCKTLTTHTPLIKGVEVLTPLIKGVDCPNHLFYSAF